MSLNLEKYQRLLTLLDDFYCHLQTNDIGKVELRQHLAGLKQVFSEEIAPKVEDDSHIQSYTTEISKQLRLLEVDVMFFQGARQPSTVQTRIKVIGDRLNTLMQYCQAILQQGTQE